jgi:hypothetical protein
MGAGMGLLLATWSTALLGDTSILLRAAPGLESAGVNPGVLGYCLMVAIATGCFRVGTCGRAAQDKRERMLKGGQLHKDSERPARSWWFPNLLSR